MSRLWTPSPLLKTSLAVHAGAVIGSTLLPNAWPWALGSLALNHGVITLAGLLPRAKWLGQNITRLDDFSMRRRSVAITIDDGPDPQVTPKVLDILDAAGVKATFFCIGQRAKQAPALCRRIVECGHRVENHGYAHSNVFFTFWPQADAFRYSGSSSLFERYNRTKSALLSSNGWTAKSILRARAG